MEENKYKSILILMQSILDEIQKHSKKIDNISIKKNDQSEDVVNRFAKNQNEFNSTLANAINSLSNKLNKTIREVLNINKQPSIPSKVAHTHYHLIGKDSIFKPWHLITLILGALIITFSAIYGPDLYFKSSEQSKELIEYKLFYDYVFFNNYDSKTVSTVSERLSDIKNEEPWILDKINQWRTEYEIEIKRSELEQELKNLEKDDR
ncbi:hypothetical protein [Nonlabens sp. Asnod3-A02]|uniref:hypothetical protein n=1 Tax=Nonlabens sp. Asnod3-A02 TaxID=3160579 RepID=UPI003866D5B0